MTCSFGTDRGLRTHDIALDARDLLITWETR